MFPWFSKDIPSLSILDKRPAAVGDREMGKLIYKLRL